MSKKSRRWDGEPETEKDRKFFDLREFGYKGWIDEDSNKAACPFCHQMDCSRQGFAGKCT
ncbi:hypothetical protein [Pseudonocardia sp.]|uniref:hypothetical protein n=1 Tax=Pseudonocardia sp. TaxID=60912 RepID=UPI003D13D670